MVSIIENPQRKVKVRHKSAESVNYQPNCLHALPEVRFSLSLSVKILHFKPMRTKHKSVKMCIFGVFSILR